MDDEYKDHRMRSKRQNPPERRSEPQTVVEQVGKGGDLTAACATNREQIYTLFKRLDEERMARITCEERIGNSVKWTPFMWVIGGCATIILMLMGIGWTHFNSANHVIREVIAEQELRMDEQGTVLNIAVTRLDDFLVMHESIVMRNDRTRQDTRHKLDNIQVKLHQMDVRLTKIER